MKIATTFFLLFMFSISFSQNSIEGIGKFKLKKTTIEQLNEIASVAKMDKMKIIGASNIYYSKYT
ncbi:MAG: hypothetical protein ACOYKE_09845, partial [Ferruginibacter sp.]